MRVKRLDVFGFKSFPHKTTIHFEPGVTAIVGPNGSGKSNLVDSIRWVLGEHNPREVRAPRLEDVIFNGTDRVAPLSMAEVNLTIANEQGLLPISFSEVTITRRVYRSGESEYLINQSPCRLRDIQELFLGTGLGGGTYAIIEQGHIDMILSSKPEERRVVFEEASGVAKYLQKKAETTRRLDEVEEHLVRIADIVGEVRRQVNALERQANKARQYQSQWDQVKQLELRLAVDELGTGEGRQQQLEAQVQALQQQRDALEQQKQAHMASLETCNASVTAMQQQVQALQAKVLTATSEIRHHESQRQLKAGWIEELTAQVQQLELEQAALQGRLSQCEEQFAVAVKSEEEMRGRSEAIQTQLAAGQDVLGGIEATLQQALQAVQAARQQLTQATVAFAHSQQTVERLTSRLQALEAQGARLEEQQTQRQSLREDVRRRVGAVQQERDTLKGQYDEVAQRVGGAHRTLEAAAARRHELAGRVHEVRDRLAQDRAQVQVLEDFYHRYEGFPETVKTLMTRAVDGVIGPLVDLVHAAPGYEEVVEAALGPLADAVVVRDREALLRCRSLLSAQQLEACRFLVLSDCPSEAVAAGQAAASNGIAGEVRQYVRTEPQYQPLVNWLLNDSWVIDDLQRLLGQRVLPHGRFVSPKGDRWDRRSWRFGGEQAARQGRVGRRQRWEQAQQQVQATTQEFARLEAQFQQAEADWQSCLGEHESAKGQLTHVSPQLQKLEAQWQQLTAEAGRLDEEEAAREREYAELAEQRERVQHEIALARQTASDSEQQQAALERTMAEAQQQREAAEQRKQELLLASAQVEAAAQSLTERLQALEARRRELETDRGNLSQQRDARRRQQEDARARGTALTTEVAHHEQETVARRQERDQCERQVEQAHQALTQEETQRDQVLPQVLAAEQQLNQVGRQLQEQTQQLSERTYRRAHVLERLRELYQIDEAAVRTELAANPPALNEAVRAQMTEQVQKLRGKLEGIGPVSLGSVEEYDELKRRWEFLQTQQNDLIQARDDLKASITQINRAARVQFRETFDRIKQEFQHYYARLFKGGEATLILLDEENVLESGIDIVARPPGKRLQSITLLSGGERALTAVALLFALFKVRPSPFCILDEIDAPLDEANVDRFTGVLEEFLALSQFILITHNKKTITKADVLYGVTMEEPGISKILSAKLGASRASGAAPTPVVTPAAA